MTDINKIYPVQYCETTTTAPSDVQAAGGMDNSQEVGNYINTLWDYLTYIKQGKNSDADIKGLMQTVKDLNAYFKANGNPNSATDPNTYKVWLAIDLIPIDGTQTLGYYANLGDAASIKALESSAAQSNLYGTDKSCVWGAVNNWYGTTPTREQMGDVSFETRLESLDTDLDNYNKSSKQSDKDKYAANILTDIKDLLAEIPNLPKGTTLPGGQINDGYLKTFQDFMTANGLDKLTTTAQMETALDATGGLGTTTVGQDFRQAVNIAGDEEYGDWPFKI